MDGAARCQALEFWGLSSALQHGAPALSVQGRRAGVQATMDWESQEDGYVAALLVDAGAKDLAVGSPVLVFVEDQARAAAAPTRHRQSPSRAFLACPVCMYRPHAAIRVCSKAFLTCPARMHCPM